MSTVAPLAEGLLERDVRALARSITLAEANHPRVSALLREVYPQTGRAVTLGVTGFPGAGKSSLVDRLIARYRAAGERIGVVAVDPSSAYSGGAILGDRVRMMRHTSDPDVFIRSMATRGHLGGLSRSTGDAIDLIDAAGYDRIIIETVGVGQDEVDVASLADVVLVVLVPGMGDDIQAIKAGILEIADIFVVNKADRDGADKLVAELRHMLELAEDRENTPPIIKTVAIREEGLDELLASIADHLEQPDVADSRKQRRLDRARVRVRDLLAARLVEAAIDAGIGAEGVDGLVAEIAERRTDPYSAAERIIEAAGWLKTSS